MPKQIKKKVVKEGTKPEKRTMFQGVKGMSDILPKEEFWWKTIWNIGHNISELHDFHFIETPVLEPAGLFEAGIGAGTDIVEKQMYVFKTRGGERVTLRPEGTAPVMRSYLENHLGYYSSPLKVYYFGPMFRYERPQAGRERQHHQWGFEIIGDGDPFYDVEIILATLAFLKALKFKDPLLKINSIGCRVCRPNYRQKLKDYYRPSKDKLCADCKIRYEKNPMRLLDCKEPECQEYKKKAPIILDFLCQACNNHLKNVLELVEDSGINYEPDPHLVRGLDYYNRTVFEVFMPSLEVSLAGGGRYDYLSEILGGRMMPSVGVALGIERLILAMKAMNFEPSHKNKPKVFFAAVGEQAKKTSLKLINQLRANGIPVSESVGKKSLKAQLKSANKGNVSQSIILGQKEVFEGSVIVRDMKSGAQETVILEKLVEEVKKRLKS